MDKYTPDLSLADVLWKHRIIRQKKSWFSDWCTIECACHAWSTTGRNMEKRIKHHIEHQAERLAWWAMKSAEEYENANHRLGR